MQVQKNNDGNIIWRHRNRQAPNPYQVEHNELYRHIREDKPINNAYYAAESTMSAVLGRMATYSGQEISWDEARKRGLSPCLKHWLGMPILDRRSELTDSTLALFQVILK